MTTIIQILTAAALVLSIIVPFGAFFLGEKIKKIVIKNLSHATAFSSSEAFLLLLS